MEEVQKLRQSEGRIPKKKERKKRKRNPDGQTLPGLLQDETAPKTFDTISKTQLQ